VREEVAEELQASVSRQVETSTSTLTQQVCTAHILQLVHVSLHASRLLCPSQAASWVHVL
jgi:hypothetical protein